jgi:membrane protein YdbS with pleckstrin-like domain
MPDIINGLFEVLGGYFIFLHIKTLYEDKEVKGVSWAAVLFFVTWGYWNLYYYPHLGQFISLVGGVVLAVANTIWLIMIIYYKRRKRPT